MSILKLRKSKGGFTLIEIMIVVLIIGILLAIAIPNFMKARETSWTKSCVANLKQIQGAKEQWMMSPPSGQAAVPAAVGDLVTQKFIKNTPTCPAGGTYSIGDASTDPACTKSADGHALPN